MDLDNCYLTLAEDPGHRIVSEIISGDSVGGLGLMLRDAHDNGFGGIYFPADLVAWDPETNEHSADHADVMALMNLQKLEDEPREHPKAKPPQPVVELLETARLHIYQFNKEVQNLTKEGS